MVMSRQRVLHLTIKDFVVDHFRVGGNGGQRRDKRDTGARVTHPPSGAVGQCTEYRTQKQNKRVAWLKCVQSDKFQNWLRIEHSRAVGDIEAAVEAGMRPQNLIIEYYDPTVGPPPLPKEAKQ